MPINKTVNGIKYDHKGDPVPKKTRKEHLHAVNRSKKAEIIRRQSKMAQLLEGNGLPDARAVQLAMADEGYDVSLRTIKGDLRAIGAVYERSDNPRINRRVWTCSAPPPPIGNEDLDKLTLARELGNKFWGLVLTVRRDGKLVFINCSVGSGPYLSLNLGALNLPGVRAIFEGLGSVLVCFDTEERAEQYAADWDSMT